MCGLAGVYHIEAGRLVDRHALESMIGTLGHRGPDDEGLYLDSNLGMAHKRLSVIDLSDAGRQPMSSEDGRFQIVFNGEVYNYLELRQALLSGGRRFRSHTDTEVVLRLYQQEGADCLRRLNGMFAFAVWDSRDRVLFAARDHFGIKPFYFAFLDGAFVFASEIKALLKAGVRPEPDPTALADYLTFQFCLDDKTLFRQVRKLPPGCYLQVFADGRLIVRPYWDADFTVDTDHTESYFQQKLAMLLEDSVRLQTRADVPLGAHLSGGFDSTTVTSLAASLGSYSFHTFNGGFEEGPEYDESSFARLAADQIGTIHHEVFPTTADFVELLPRLIYFMDEPAAGPSLLPQYCVARLASRHVKVVLSGHGGDEIFGGYTRYLAAYFEACLKGSIDGSQEDHPYVVTFESILPNLRQLQGYESLLKLFWRDGLFEPADHRYFRLIDRSHDLRGVIFEEVWRPAEYSPFEAYQAIFNHPACHSLINKMTRFDLKTLLPALLHVEDRASMAVSLESRVPLLDHRIVELVAAMPPVIKFRGGRSKHIFREAVRHLVPAEVYARTDKKGFPVPLDRWYRRKEVQTFIRETLLSGRARSRGLWRAEAVELLLKTEQPYSRGVWGLLCLELWHRQFLDQA